LVDIIKFSNVNVVKFFWTRWM